jgi:hypothetical protein
MANLPERSDDGKLPSFTSLGGYPIIYLTKRCDLLCAKCAAEALDAESDDPPIACDAFYEGSPHSCANCSDLIMSAYGDPYCEHTIGADGNCTICGGS